jgi:hypothetical protein
MAAPNALRSAVGCSVHTGWAVLVAILGPASDPSVAIRRRVALVPYGEDGAAYHAAEEMALADAEVLVNRASAQAVTKAADAFDALATDLGTDAPLEAVGIVESNSSLPSSLEVILRSHALIHSAEGALFRRALETAASGRKLTVLGVPSKQLHARTALRLGLRADALSSWLAERGRAVGRPWGRDEKEALLVACLALSAR